MAAYAACAVGASIAWFGVDLHRFWFREFVLNQGARPIAAYNVQSVNGFLAHLLARGHLRDWYPIDAGARFSMERRAHGRTRRRRGPLMLAGRPGAKQRGTTGGTLAGPLPHRPDRTDFVDTLRSAVADSRSRARIAVGISRTATRVGLVAALVLIAPPVVVLSVQSRIGNALYERLLISHYFAGAVHHHLPRAFP